MIRVSIDDPAFYPAYWRAVQALPVETLESPRQYGRRWREAYRCRVDPNPHASGTYYIFDQDEDYTWFMLRWR